MESDKRSLPDEGPSPGISQGRFRRAVPLIGLTARTGGQALVGRLRQGRGEPLSPARYERDAARYAELLGRSKGVLMKVGQMLSVVSFGTTMPDEQRAIYQGALSRLQMEAPPMAPGLAYATVNQELGRPWREVFASFDPMPLAAASIGQVHHAVLHDGREAAVKVQYPGVAKAIEADLKNTELLGAFLQLLRSFVPGVTRIDVKGMADEVASRLHEELDYRQEAANQAEFADLYRGHPFIHIPEVIEEHCTDRLLVQDFVSGRRWPDPIEADKELRDRWGEVLFRFGFGHLRRNRLINVDPHPGNYLFHDDGSMTFVDFGCVRRYSLDQGAYISASLTCALNEDANGLWEVHVKAGIMKPSDPVSPEELLAYWRDEASYALLPQPATVTPELVAETLKGTYSPVGPSANVVRRLRLPPDLLFMARIDMGLWSVIGELRATADWRSLSSEFDEGTPPTTELGRVDEAFWRSQVTM